MANKWSEQENATLQKHGLSRMDLLPGRSYDAAKKQSSRLGYAVPQASHDWSPAEEKILRKIYRNKVSIKGQIGLLPGRSYRSVTTHAKRLGISGNLGKKLGGTGYSFLETFFARELEYSDPMTLSELAELAGCTYEGARQAMHRGHGKQFFVEGWRVTPESTIALWALGTEPDAPRPDRKEGRLRLQREANRRFRAKQSGVSNPFAVAMNQVMQEAA